MSVGGKALVYNCALETSSNYAKNVALHSGDMRNLSNSSGVYQKSNRPLTSCGPSSSCEALRYAVAALNRLDDFTCEKIGAGFFSEVFKVTHRITGQVMVLKMNTSLSNRSNMLREVQLMNRLSHENILRFMGVCVHEGQLHALTEITWLCLLAEDELLFDASKTRRFQHVTSRVTVLKFINGGSLEQLLQNKQVDLPWETRIKLSLDIARGMCYLHSRGVFHRDLTSKNVLIKKQGSLLLAVVGDFGLAERIPDPRNKSQRLPIVGSPYWMAPECLRSEWYNEKADIFSFGIIMCEIIARIEADPDILPRTENFGVDYVAFSDMCPECPPQFLELAFTSCRIDPASRPSFKELVALLENLLNIISSMSGGSHCFYPPMVTYTSCFDDGDSIDNVRAIFASGWSKQHTDMYNPDASVSKMTQVEVTPERHKFPEVSSRSIPVTPKHVGEAMSLNDPHYKPNSSAYNPFASLPRFWKGKKFLEPTNFSDPDITLSCNFDLLSPPCAPTPPGTPNSQDDMSSLSVCDRTHKKSKSLPSSPVLQRKSVKRQIMYANMSTEEAIDSPRSVSPGPMSPSSSLSPYETDESLFSGYGSIHTQLNDCKIGETCITYREIKKLPNSNGVAASPSEAMMFRSKTPLCAKLRRSSGESGFFSVCDRNSTCDLSLDSCHNQEDMSSWTTDSSTEQQSETLSNIDEREQYQNSKKRPSSFYSDDSGCSCGLLITQHVSDGRVESANNDRTKPFMAEDATVLVTNTVVSCHGNMAAVRCDVCDRLDTSGSCLSADEASSQPEDHLNHLQSNSGISAGGSCYFYGKDNSVTNSAQSITVKNNRSSKYMRK